MREQNLNVKLQVTIVGIDWLEPLVRRINWRLDTIMANLQERFDALEANQNATKDKLNESSGEILAELALLRQGGNLTPEQEASLQRIEANANALATQAATLADISPPLPQ